MSDSRSYGRAERDERRSFDEASWRWRGGAIAGFVATVVMGLAITLVEASTMQVAIAGLYGQSGNLLAGWLAHLVHGTLFGVLFGVLLSDPGIHRVADWYWKSIIAGVTYGLVLAVVGAGIIMPIWLNVAGFPAPPPIPNVTSSLLVWHLLYGLVLGGVFPAVKTR